MDSETRSKIEKTLGEPFYGDLPENAIKVRRNLLSISFIAILFLLNGSSIDSNSTIFGIKFTNIDIAIVPTALLVLNVYFLIHFVWYIIEAFIEWQLRLTGTKVVYQTAMKWTSEEGDYPDDPRQSTLYNWWINKNHYFGDIHGRIDKIEQLTLELREELTESNNNISKVNHSYDKVNIQALKNEIKSLRDQLENLSKTTNSNRIQVSLQRFDNRFKLILRIQSLRWLVIDLISPSLIGIFSSLWLILKITNN